MAILDRRPQRLDIHMMAGDPLTIVCPVTAGGSPADLTGKTFRAGIRQRDGSELAMAVSVSGSEVTARLGRTVSAQLERQQTWGLETHADGGRDMA